MEGDSDMVEMLLWNRRNKWDKVKFIINWLVVGKFQPGELDKGMV